MDLINENIIKTVLTVSGTVLAAILGKQSLSNLFDSLQRRNLKNVLNDLETFSALDKFDDDFKTKFIEPHVKELYFFLKLELIQMRNQYRNTFLLKIN